jgi:hypothetical protein
VILHRIRGISRERKAALLQVLQRFKFYMLQFGAQFRAPSFAPKFCQAVRNVVANVAEFIWFIQSGSTNYNCMSL